MRVLITRAEPAATQTANSLKASGHEAILLPLFEVINLQNPIPDDDYDGIIFTSRNSVEALHKHEFNNKNIPAYCVGEKTEKAAQYIGFKTTHTAKGGGAALANLMQTMKLSGKKLLYPTTPDRSFDMDSALEPSGIHVQTIDIYRVNPITPDRQATEDAITKISNAYIFAYSSLSSHHLAHILETINMTSVLKACTLIGISKHAVKPLEHIEWKEVLVANQPDETQMIALLN